MGGMRKAAVTCDQCGRMEEAPMGDLAFGVPPRGWVVVAFDPPPGDHLKAKQSAELCSWLCVSAYAAERTDEEARRRPEQAAPLDLGVT